MNSKIALAAATLLSAFAVSAQAQTTCSCDSSAVRTTNSAALTALLSNKMVCANVSGEVWQEHHASGGGTLTDYKKGPSDARDPSAVVGSYVVNADNTVTYNYLGGGGSYTYEVCYASGTNTYTFCGARTITGARVGGAGLASCSGISVAVPPSAATTSRTLR